MRTLLLPLVFLLRLLLSAPTRSSTVQAETCQDLLDNNVHRCQVKGDFFDGAFEECFRFTTPGVRSENFDLALDLGPGVILSCDCQAKGGFKNPRFSAAKEFHCVTDPVNGAIGIQFTGRVGGKGATLRDVQGVNNFGSSFVAACERDPACSISPPTRVGVSVWSKQE